ncbi:MAG: glycerol-3-phosphate 1-O-acyltransferase PlsY [Pseudomonadota bacterium]
MMEVLVKTGLAYLMGSVLGALLVGKLFGGVDIRKVGSGNAGGTNALRTQGFLFALLVVVVDVGKGALAVAWLPGLAIPGVVPSGWSQVQLACICGAAAVVGHVFPIYFSFKGGKGVATLVGAVAALSIKAALIALLCFVVLLLLSGFVGLSSIVATGSLAVFAWLNFGLNSSWFAFGLGMFLFVLFTHRSNIARMLNGTEDRKRSIMVFHRWLGS